MLLADSSLPLVSQVPGFFGSPSTACPWVAVCISHRKPFCTKGEKHPLAQCNNGSVQLESLACSVCYLPLPPPRIHPAGNGSHLLAAAGQGRCQYLHPTFPLRTLWPGWRQAASCHWQFGGRMCAVLVPWNVWGLLPRTLSGHLCSHCEIQKLDYELEQERII